MFTIPTEITMLDAIPEGLAASVLTVALYLSIGILVQKFEGGQKSLARIMRWPWIGNQGQRGKYGWY